ncbi:uncharacterized protein BXZ73DRAFT_78050 [Epithele typhae]|uniref:uncharacterized protein n=1 Tax=Epithele typhae TaxID=378194 RepID=UPI002007A10F|nr:uncharacterized protein BXZ73DRAFT_78050 [Epithele typhae]KAH9929945.1 hypothetical protein BXZ73DRAFT_78050 [Epithele typhae]
MSKESRDPLRARSEEGGGGGVRGVRAPSDRGGGIGEERAAVGPCGAAGAGDGVLEDAEGGELDEGTIVGERGPLDMVEEDGGPVDVPRGAHGHPEESAERSLEGCGLGVPVRRRVTGGGRGDDRPPRARGVGVEPVNVEIDHLAECLEALGVAHLQGVSGGVGAGGVEWWSAARVAWSAVGAALAGATGVEAGGGGGGRGRGSGGCRRAPDEALAGRAGYPLPLPLSAGACNRHPGGLGNASQGRGAGGRLGRSPEGPGWKGRDTGGCSRRESGGHRASHGGSLEDGGRRGGGWRRRLEGRGGEGCSRGELDEDDVHGVRRSRRGRGGGRVGCLVAEVGRDVGVIHGQHALRGVLDPELRPVEEVGGLCEVGVVEGAELERDPEDVEKELPRRGGGRSCGGRGGRGRSRGGGRGVIGVAAGDDGGGGREHQKNPHLQMSDNTTNLRANTSLTV